MNCFKFCFQFNLRRYISAGQYPDLCTRVVEVSPYQSIIHSLWWAIVTMATVGRCSLTVSNPHTPPGVRLTLKYYMTFKDKPRFETVCYFKTS
jgi:hypothetical protein